MSNQPGSEPQGCLTGIDDRGILNRVQRKLTDRLKIGNFVIDPKPAYSTERGAWIADFCLEEHCPSYVDDTVFFGRQEFPTREEAIVACHVLGRREIAKREE